MDDVEQIELEDVIDLRKNPATMAEDLSEKERIQLLRNEGSEVQRKGLRSIFGGNKWKPQKNRERMWVEKLDEGRKPVRELIRSHLRKKGKDVSLSFDRVSERSTGQREKVKNRSSQTAEKQRRYAKSGVEPDEKGRTTLDQFG